VRCAALTSRRDRKAFQLPHVCCLIASSLALAQVSGGCSPPSSGFATARAHSQAELFGPQSDRRHDFGTILARPGRAVTHSFLLINNTGRQLRLVRAVNRKPCCGEVRFDPKTLAPGEQTTLTVTLRIGDSAEPLSHLAVVETDDPVFPTRDYFTFARPQPRFRLEPADSNGVLSVRPSSTVRAAFTAFSFGTVSEPPTPLGDSTIESALKVEWAAGPRNSSLSNGLSAQSRQFSLILRGDGEPGERSSTVTVRHGDDVLGSTTLRWEVAQAVKAVPGALVLSARDGDVQHVVSLRSDRTTKPPSAC
jgi:hypothetical protein